MAQHRLCPWWIGYFLAHPLRRLAQDPAPILGPHVRPGMTVLEPGPGMGFFTLELARMVGPGGRVVAVDIQPKMIEVLKRRAGKAGLLGQLDARLSSPDSMGLADLAGSIDFIFAFATVHEMPSTRVFFAEAARILKPGGRLLLAEPGGHMDLGEFETELRVANQAGLREASRPRIRWSHAALLEKPPGGRPGA